MSKKIGKAKALQLVETMLTIRHLEQRLRRLFADGEVKGFVHLSVGQEAVPTGVCANLSNEDKITSTHRGHGHLIAKGGDLSAAMAELLGKETGMCKGRGGSMHVADGKLGILGANGIVGAGTVISVGAGLSAKYLDNGQVSVCFFGDAASNQGMFHEAANMAAVMHLPVVFVCENNGWGEFTSFEQHMAIASVADRAAAYGMPGITVDGDDVVEVYHAAKEAIERARKGGGPSVLECTTHRWYGHFEGDPQKYRDPAELEEVEKHCPIDKWKETFIGGKVVGQKAFDKVDQRVMEAIEEAVEFARQSPEPDPEDFARYNYAD